MKPVVLSRLIQRNQADTFEVFSDLANASERITDIVKLELHTDGPMKCGTRWTETRVLFGKEATETMEITEFRPPHSYTAEASSHGSHYKSVWQFEAQGQQTKVTMDFTATPLTFFAKIMGFIMGPMMRKSVVKCLEQDIDDLQRFLESDLQGQS